MRQHLISVAAGLIAGIAGALLVGRFALPTAQKEEVTEATQQDVRATVMPPGWDRILSSRVSNLEADVADQRAALADLEQTELAPGATDAGTGSGEVDPVAEREAQRRVHYAKELATRAEMIAAHEREAVDSPWAQSVSTRLVQQLETLDRGPRPQANAIDCRSKTCIANLTFPSPMDGLAFLQNDLIPVPEACNGFIATPPPSKDGGEYELSVIYSCR